MRQHAPNYPPFAHRAPDESPPRIPNVWEQMGVDPTSKLAAAIRRLCDILEGVRD